MVVEEAEPRQRSGRGGKGFEGKQPHGPSRVSILSSERKEVGKKGGQKKKQKEELKGIQAEGALLDEAVKE
ncbi:hypothetical protein RJZ57_008425 [Blastomyces gilchristii]